MNKRRLLIGFGAAVSVMTFSALGFILLSTPFIPSLNAEVATFSTALWKLRAVDIFVQVMIIFAAAMGILVFFNERDGK